MCDCGCGGCSPQKPVMLNESLAPKEILSEGLKYHMDNNMPLTEHVYRAGSQKYFELWAEARALYTRGILEVTDNDLEVLTETDLGHFGMFEGKKVPLDFPIELNEVHKLLRQSKLSSEEYQKAKKLKGFNADDYTFSSDNNLYVKKESLEEKKKAKKNTKKLNKPMRDSSGGKAYKVYVKDPKTKKVKTVRFGSGGLRAKINDKEARNAFAARHKCSTKKDKTKAGYWSCRLPRYAKLLGLKSNFGGFW
jgi:hypothetical protein